MEKEQEEDDKYKEEYEVEKEGRRKRKDYPCTLTLFISFSIKYFSRLKFTHPSITGGKEERIGFFFLSFSEKPKPIIVYHYCNFFML